MDLAPSKCLKNGGDSAVWGINSVIFERDLDLQFDMHHEDKMEQHQRDRREGVIERANELNIPVYACHAIPDTTYIRYPIEDVITEFKTGYFSNGVCYMIALAVFLGVEEINTYGVNHMRINFADEYTIQKPGVDYWIGIARGRGVKFNIHGAHAEIGRTFFNRAYGYGLSQEGMIKKYDRDRSGNGAMRNEVADKTIQ